MAFIKTIVDNRGVISSQQDDQPVNIFEIQGTLSASSIQGGVSVNSYNNYYSQKIIVGISASGDTATSCHYLDNGDGLGLSGALSYALSLSYPVEVFIKPGTIVTNFDAPMRVPASSSVRGSGKERTIIWCNTGSANTHQALFTGSYNCSLEDMTVVVPAPGASMPATTAPGVIQFGNSAKFRRFNMFVTGTSGIVKLTQMIYIPCELAKPVDDIVFEGVSIDASKMIPRTTTISAIDILGPSVTGQAYYSSDNPLTINGLKVSGYATSGSDVAINAMRVRGGVFNYTANNIQLKDAVGFSVIAPFTNTVTTSIQGPNISNVSLNAPNTFGTSPYVFSINPTMNTSAPFVINGMNINNINITGLTGSTIPAQIAFYAGASNGNLIYQGINVNNVSITGSSTTSIIYVNAFNNVTNGIYNVNINNVNGIGKVYLQPQNNATVMSAAINNCNISTIQVDSGSQAITIGSTVNANTYTITSIDTKIANKNQTKTMTANASILVNDETIFVNLSAPATASLPNPAYAKGKQFTIKDIGGNLSTNNLLVLRNGSETINGSATNDTLNTNYSTTRYMSDGTNWNRG